MRFLKTIFFSAVIYIFVSITGCSAKKQLLPVNAISEPLFFDSTYAIIGLQNNIWTKQNSHSDSASFQIAPRWKFEIPINKWCSYNAIPINYNFLLSGDQYNDSGLIKNNIHLVLSGGIDGFSYKTGDGFSVPGSIHLNGKFINTEYIYMFASTGIKSFDLTKFNTFSTNELLGIGIQATNQFSIFGSQGVDIFSAGKYYSLSQYGVEYISGESSATANLGGELYITQHHKIDAVASYLVKNFESGKDDVWIGSIGYSYIF